jgi:hypothetical protein
VDVICKAIEEILGPFLEYKVEVAALIKKFKVVILKL